MVKLIKQSNWLTGSMIFFMPILLIFFLGSQMAVGQVRSKFEAYQRIPEITSLSELESIPAGQVVMLRGRMAEAIVPAASPMQELVVFQERPADGREVRYREEFPLEFPELGLDLPDGTVMILPSQTRERVIQNELHQVRQGDRDYTGFRVGDLVTVQGEWQPAGGPTLIDVTGISGSDKQSLMAGWQDAFRKVSWARNGFGLLTAVSLILLVIQLRRRRGRSSPPSEEEAWPTPETKTAPTA